MSISRLLIGLGLIILLVGITWPWLSRLGLGRLPGDIVVERENFHFYFPACDQHYREHHFQCGLVAAQSLAPDAQTMMTQSRLPSSYVPPRNAGCRLWTAPCLASVGCG